MDDTAKSMFRIRANTPAATRAHLRGAVDSIEGLNLKLLKGLQAGGCKALYDRLRYHQITCNTATHPNGSFALAEVIDPTNRTAGVFAWQSKYFEVIIEAHITGALGRGDEG